MSHRERMGLLLVASALGALFGAACSSSKPEFDCDGSVDVDSDTDVDVDSDADSDADADGGAESCLEYDPCGDHGTCDDSLGVVLCDCDYGWGGDLCDECAPGFHADGDSCALDETCFSTTCQGHGECDDSTGVVLCDCDEGYVGDYCEFCDSGYHAIVGGCALDEECPAAEACNGHGTCDDSTGVAVCSCEVGYEGDTCGVCAAGFHLGEAAFADAGVDGGAAELTCLLDEQCVETSCSGHGTCDVVSGVVVCECGAGYAGTYCDTCDADFHAVGDSCVADETCPSSGACSGNGTCDDATGVAICTCYDGYAGDTCDQCAAGFHPDTDGACALDEQCMPNSCSGDAHGDCDDSSGVVICDCFDTDGYTGTYCEDCLSGYHLVGLDCVVNETCPSSGACSGNGTCDDTTGIAICSCYDGYAGDTCNQCAAGFHPDTDGACALDEQCMPNSCSGDAHGDCDDSGGVVTCDCFDTDGYTGTYCEDCLAGYHLVGLDCAEDEVCDSEPFATTCNSRGDCSVVDGLISCACDFGWTGATCNQCAPGFVADTDGECVLANEYCLADEASCSFHGTCDDSTGTVICSCDAGYDSSTYCATCASGYHRDAGDACVLNETCPSTGACSGYGSCAVVDGVAVCTCDEGWAGDDCSTCALNYYDADPDPVAMDCQLSEVCLAGEASCAYHGTCDDSTGVVLCTCESAAYDSSAYCADCASGYHANTTGDCVPDGTCSGYDCNYGTCSLIDGEPVCSCDTGYLEPSCDTCEPYFQDNDSDGDCTIDCDLGAINCGSYGTCSDASGTAHCACNTGWTGTYCATCVDDAQEDDDDFASAHVVNADLTLSNLVICGDDQDWYEVILPEGGSVSVLVSFTSSATGDIDIALYKAGNSTPVASSTSTTNNESISYPVPSGEAGTYYLQIYGFDRVTSDFVRNTYSLSIDREGCDTCETLGYECGWSGDNGCGTTITCECTSGIECDSYNHVCAETLEDLGYYGCCVAATNTSWWYDAGDQSYSCDPGTTCTWVEAYETFTCWDSVGTPPVGLIQECPAYFF